MAAEDDVLAAAFFTYLESVQKALLALVDHIDKALQVLAASSPDVNVSIESIGLGSSGPKTSGN